MCVHIISTSWQYYEITGTKSTSVSMHTERTIDIILELHNELVYMAGQVEVLIQRSIHKYLKRIQKNLGEFN